VAWLSGNAFDSINKVTLRRAGILLRWVGKSSTGLSGWG